jgi:ribulose-phosphate 3-epimerase
LIELAPSILSADFAHLADQVERATAGGASVIHVDIMDGHFVPNLTLGPPVVKSLRRATRLPLDCHLMIENPDQYIAGFCGGGSGLDFGASGGVPAFEPDASPDQAA